MPDPRAVLAAASAVLASSFAALPACDVADDGLAAVSPAERLPGGLGSNELLLGPNAFSPALSTLTTEEQLGFFSGNAFFGDAWVQAPSSTDARDGLGPVFNARSCGACHSKDGRGRPPLTPEEPVLGLLFRLSIPGAASDEPPRPDLVYGDQLQPFGIDGVPGEATPRVEVEEVHGSYGDGTPWTLLAPRYHLDAPQFGPLPEDLQVSPRVAPQVIGVGLLEAIPAADIIAGADPDDADGDGISGRVQWVPEPRTGELAVGRFGWKGDQPTLEGQTAGALHGDMGLTSSLARGPVCSEAQAACAASPDGGDPEVSDLIFTRMVQYLQFLSVPARASWDAPEVRRGKAVFMRLGCASCHTPEHRTADDAVSPALAGQRIFPYTDLLLHDMGEGLADDRPVFQASGREWKTPPLWGVGRIPKVNGHDRLLHDGRARGVAEAILWHGGEAQAARDGFVALSADERAALLTFVESL